MSKDYFRTEVDVQNRVIKKAQETILKLQGQCPHETSVYQNCGSSGDWDREASYWRQFYCYDCGLRWTSDQSLSNKGHAMEVSGIDYKATPREIELQRELKALKAKR